MKSILKIFGKFFDINTPIGRCEFWAFVTLTVLLGTFICFVNWLIYEWTSLCSDDICYYLLICLGFGLFFAVIRRLRNYGMDFDSIMLDIIKIVLISFIPLGVLKLNYSFLGRLYCPVANKFNMAVLGFFALWALFYIFRFLFCAMFLAGADIKEDEKAYSLSDYKKIVPKRLLDVLKGFYLFFLKIFDYRGRSDRYEFFIWGLGSLFAFYFCNKSFYSLNFLFFRENYGENVPLSQAYWTVWLGLGITVFLIFLLSSLSVRRARDLGLNPWFSLFIFIFIPLIYCPIFDMLELFYTGTENIVFSLIFYSFFIFGKSVRK
ncbi:MAG: DUF805 domain-containing protein [Armatimonadetes bacterium]|nr:DUF805 domain-containing protein [Candidatus Hippobium faecium]